MSPCRDGAADRILGGKTTNQRWAIFSRTGLRLDLGTPFHVAILLSTHCIVAARLLDLKLVVARFAKSQSDCQRRHGLAFSTISRLPKWTTLKATRAFSVLRLRDRPFTVPRIGMLFALTPEPASHVA